MYYVILDSGVVSANNLTLLNKKLSSAMQEDEFTIVGKDFVSKLNYQDLDFVQDKHKMENIVFSNFFRKDNSVKFMCLFIMIMNFVNIILTSNVGNNVKAIMSAFGGMK